jgi:hypothetical protein
MCYAINPVVAFAFGAGKGGLPQEPQTAFAKFFVKGLLQTLATWLPDDSTHLARVKTMMQEFLSALHLLGLCDCGRKETGGDAMELWAKLEQLAPCLTNNEQARVVWLQNNWGNEQARVHPRLVVRALILYNPKTRHYLPALKETGEKKFLPVTSIRRRQAKQAAPIDLPTEFSNGVRVGQHGTWQLCGMVFGQPLEPDRNTNTAAPQNEPRRKKQKK